MAFFRKSGDRQIGPFDVPISGWLRAIAQTVLAAFDSDVTMWCAGVAFYSFLSIFPAIAIAVFIFGLAANPAAIAGWVDQLGTIAPEQAVAIIDSRLQTLINRPRSDLGVGLLISVAFALWTGSRGINALLFALTRVHEAHQMRGFVTSALVAIGMTIGAFAIAMLAIIGVAVLPALTALLPFGLFAENIALLGRWPILAFVIFITLSMLYRFGPYRLDPSWFRILPGAAFATIMWLAASLAFSAYVENFSNYDVTFGSLAATVILMLWLYYSVLIIILGATLNAELEYEARKSLISS
jgi:membrane protein